MSENRKLSMSRRDFMRLSALAAGGAALAGLCPKFSWPTRRTRSKSPYESRA